MTQATAAQINPPGFRANVDADPQTHPSVLAFCPWEDGGISIDVEIVPVVQALWDAEIRTGSSCQGFGDGIADIDIDLSSTGQLAYLLSCIHEPWIETISLTFPQGMRYNRKTQQNETYTIQSVKSLRFPREHAAELARLIEKHR